MESSAYLFGPSKLHFPKFGKGAVSSKKEWAAQAYARSLAANERKNGFLS
jgi:hypothetical protein